MVEKKRKKARKEKKKKPGTSGEIKIDFMFFEWFSSVSSAPNMLIMKIDHEKLIVDEVSWKIT